MRIGIDASRAFTPRPTGTERYASQLIRALVTAAPDVAFRLYTRGEPVPEWVEKPNVEVRAIPFPRLWTHLRLSAELRRSPVDHLLVPAHVLPLVHPPHSSVTVHDLGYLYFPQAHAVRDRTYLDLSTRWSAHTAEWLWADSEATRDDLVRWYHVSPSKIVVAYPGVDESLRRPPEREIQLLRERYGLGRYVLSVGTIQPRKNYMRLIEAFSRQDTGLCLVIAGRKGWLCGEILETSARLQVQERVRFLDYVPQEELAALYAGAAAFIMPSLYEGFGLPVLEAMACGTPVACSNTSSLPEVGGEAALLFAPQNVGTIASAIARLVEDPAERARRVELGYKNVRRFTWDHCARTMLERIVP